MEGLVIFNKPKKFSSFQIVNFFKKKFNIKKVGHGGTLDPLAEGVLIIGLGKATKDLRFFLTKSKKTYLAEAVLGVSTSSYDLESDNMIFANCQNLPSQEKIVNLVNTFKGVIHQSPPLFSAIKYHGKPLHRLVREGKIGLSFPLPQRKVIIYDIEVKDYKILTENEAVNIIGTKLDSSQSLGLLKLKVVASSGVYIRSLINDLGQKIGCGACLVHLLRKTIEIEDGEFFEKYGQKIFYLSRALTFSDIENNNIELKARVFGKVQGVNFRYFTYTMSQDLNLKGYVKNLENGGAEVVAQGKLDKVIKLIEFLKRGPELAKVNNLNTILMKIDYEYENFSLIY